MSKYSGAKKVKNGLFVLWMGALLCVPGSASEQKKTAPKSLAQLELTMEVATTSEEGYPSTIRITVKNIGALPVDMPMPESPCVVGGGGVEVLTVLHPMDPKEHTWLPGIGTGCGMDHFPSLQWRVENQWIRLRPGEFISLTQSTRRTFRERKPGPGIIELWAEYIPPEVTPEEYVELRQVGYIIPTEKIETERRSFTIR